MAPKRRKADSDDDYAPSQSSVLSSPSAPQLSDPFVDIRIQEQLPLSFAQDASNRGAHADMKTQVEKLSQPGNGSRHASEVSEFISTQFAPQAELEAPAQFAVAGSRLDLHADNMGHISWSDVHNWWNTNGGNHNVEQSQEDSQTRQQWYGGPSYVSFLESPKEQDCQWLGFWSSNSMSESAAMNYGYRAPVNPQGHASTQAIYNGAFQVPFSDPARRTRRPRVQNEMSDWGSPAQQAASAQRPYANAAMAYGFPSSGSHYTEMYPISVLGCPSFTMPAQSQTQVHNSFAAHVPMPTGTSYGLPLQPNGIGMGHHVQKAPLPIMRSMSQHVGMPSNWGQSPFASMITAPNAGGTTFTSSVAYDNHNDPRSYTHSSSTLGSSPFGNPSVPVAPSRTMTSLHNSSPTSQGKSVDDLLQHSGMTIPGTTGRSQDGTNVKSWLSSVQQAYFPGRQLNDCSILSDAGIYSFASGNLEGLPTTFDQTVEQPDDTSATFGTRLMPEHPLPDAAQLFGGDVGTLPPPHLVKFYDANGVPVTMNRLAPGQDHVLENMFGPDPRWNTYLPPEPGVCRRSLAENSFKVSEEDDADESDFQLRSSRASRLAARSHQDTDVLSGYPARQWAKETANVSLVPPKAAQPTETKVQSAWASPPMPKGSEMYTEFAQKLLAKMRAPQVPEEDRETPEEGEEDAHGEEDHTVRVPKYNLVPLGKEPPGRRFLAERRKGLSSLYEGTGTVQTKRKAKVKQTLADGTEHIIEVLVPEGQTIPGEVSESAAPAVAAELLPAGTVVEGVGVANSDGVVVAASEATTPQSNRRKPPPPKRKKPHPLKGKKKKVILEVPNADGTLEMVESGTLRPDEEDDDDEGEEGEGEGTDDASPTPGAVGTPAVSEPPRSVPTDIPVVSVDSGDDPTGNTQLSDAMDIDVHVPAPTTLGPDASASSDTAIAKTPVQSEKPAQQDEPGSTLPSSDFDASIAVGLTQGAQAADVEKSAQQAEPSITKPESEPASQVISAPGEAVEPPTTSDPAPNADPTIPVEPTVSKDDLTATEVAANPPDAPVLASAEPAAPASELPAPVTHDTVPDVLKPEEVASSNPVEGGDMAAPESVAPATEDSVPEPLKPEEIASSNPVETPAEKKEEKTDILGSLEQSLG